MSTGLLESRPKMGRRRADDPRPKRNDITVKVDFDVIAEAKMVATSRNISLAEYLSESLRPIVRRDLEQETARRINPPKPKSDRSR